MIQIGQYHTLDIVSENKAGVILEDESGETVLLPHQERPRHTDLDLIDDLRVFVYLDGREKKAATLTEPKIVLHEFALLRVTAVDKIGAFLDWGLEKELLVPFREQKQKMEAGRWYVVYLDFDEQTGRLYASSRINRYIQNEALTVIEGEKVDLLILQKTDLGFSVIVNHAHRGLVYDNEIFIELNVGDQFPGYVKKIHKSSWGDNKIDISLQPIGYHQSIDTHVDVILQALEQNGGFLNVTDKSAPEEISNRFGMSKKAFKKSLGALYKQKTIEILPDGITLTDEKGN